MLRTARDERVSLIVETKFGHEGNPVVIELLSAIEKTNATRRGRRVRWIGGLLHDEIEDVDSGSVAGQ